MSTQEAAAPFTYFADIAATVSPIAPDSIVSRTVLKRDGTHLVVFGFAPGQELSEHTSARAVILHMLRGRARLTLGSEAADAGPGTVVYMEPHLPHSVVAEEETVLVLVMMERGAGS